MTEYKYYISPLCAPFYENVAITSFHQNENWIYIYISYNVSELFGWFWTIIRTGKHSFRPIRVGKTWYCPDCLNTAVWRYDFPSILVYSWCKSLITSLTRKTARCFRQHPWESILASCANIEHLSVNWERGEGRSQRDNRVDCSNPTPSTKCRSIRALFTFICIRLIYDQFFFFASFRG